LLIQGVLATAALIALSTVPFGIGEPLIRVPFVEMMVKALGSLAVIGGVAALGYLMARGSVAQLSAWRRGGRLAAAAGVIAVPLVAAGSMAGLVRASTPERERERDPNKRPITLSRGFASNIFVQGTMDNPTSIAFGPDGKLYIADISGAIWMADDADRDG